MAVLPHCDGEAPDPPPPPSIAPPPSVTKTHDSSSAAVHDSSITAVIEVAAISNVAAITPVDVVATVVDVAPPPESSDLDGDELDEDEENTFVQRLQPLWARGRNLFTSRLLQPLRNLQLQGSEFQRLLDTR